LVDYAAMAHALVALGSNLGDRAEQLSAALLELTRLSNSRLIRRSGWFETPPIGGPTGQGAFLNGAALLWTALSPRQLLAELQRIEEQLGRVRGERWGARVLDLDLLLFDQLVIGHPDSSPGLRPGVDTRTMPLRSAALPPGGAGGCHEGDDASGDEPIVPHPRMAFRRFVLEPAAAAAPWMVHPTSGWTVQALFAQLTCGADVTAVAAEEASKAAAWVERLRMRFGAGPRIVTWDAYRALPGGEGAPRPKLILAFSSGEGTALPAFHAGARSRRMPNLPTGPIAWIPSTGVAEPMVEAAAAIQAVWPELASIAPPSD
jgi:2-amino-4-hydroxy-6-hydroxymethyldihydropteridine diphosphokinase